MCGIAGGIGLTNADVLRQMTDVFSYRGPDGHGYLIDEEVFLGHARLSILDHAGGAQPMTSLCGKYSIVFNGEIYNHRELRQELESTGFIFQSDHSDTEVLLVAYQVWGQSMLQKLNGMFAFCILDKISGILLLARDRFGEKPLFYCTNNNFFAFSSELTSFTVNGSFDLTYSSASMQKFFAYGFFPGERTIYNEIRKLPAASFITVNINTKATRQYTYWEYRINKLPSSKFSYCDALDHLEDLLEKSVTARLDADVEKGIFLSGGIDSSLVLAAANKVQGENRLSTFTLGFDDDSYDESKVARQIAHIFKTNHYEDVVSADKCLATTEYLLNVLSEPIGDSSVVPTWLVSNLASKHAKVILSGDGGDELFYGYEPFKILKCAELYAKYLPASIRKIIPSIFKSLDSGSAYMTRRYKIMKATTGLAYHQSMWNPVWGGALSASEIEELFNIQISPEELYSESIDFWSSSSAENIHDLSSEYYAKFYLQDSVLTKVDRASMLNGIEVRSPFLDNEIVQFASSLPLEFKIGSGLQKRLLRDLLSRSLPRSIASAKKRGFAFPIVNVVSKISNDPFGSMRELKDVDQAAFSRFSSFKNNNHKQFVWAACMLSNYIGRNSYKWN